MKQEITKITLEVTGSLLSPFIQEKFIYINNEHIFFTSDTHFFHENIIKFCDRPFESIEEMNEKLIANWNSVVGQDDVVFHLGDFALGGRENWDKVLPRLNGRIFLIIGNHDLRTIQEGYTNRFEEICMQMRIQIGKRKILLNHCPFLCFDGSYKDRWQLFGHVHTNKSNLGADAKRLKYLLPTQYDVGVDNNDFTPISYPKLREIILKQVENYQELP